MSRRRASDAEVREWAKKIVATAPPLSDEQKVIIRTALMPVIREQRKNQGRAA